MLGVADYYSTVLVLASGKGVEANPIMRFFMEMYGIEGSLWFQILSWVLVVLITFVYPFQEIFVDVLVVLLLKALVVLNNVINAEVVWVHADKDKGVQGGGEANSEATRGGT